MKSPFVISIVVLILFVLLVIFSVFKGPVEQSNGDILPEGEILIREEKPSENPSVRVNLATASGDKSKCKGDKSCEVSFIFNTAEELEDCDVLELEELVVNCKDNVLLLKSMEDNKELCNQIQDIEMKKMCEEINL